MPLIGTHFYDVLSKPFGCLRGAWPSRGGWLPCRSYLIAPAIYFQNWMRRVADAYAVTLFRRNLRGVIFECAINFRTRRNL